MHHTIGNLWKMIGGWFRDLYDQLQKVMPDIKSIKGMGPGVDPDPYGLHGSKKNLWQQPGSGHTWTPYFGPYKLGGLLAGHEADYVKAAALYRTESQSFSGNLDGGNC